MKATIKNTLKTEWFLVKLMFKTDPFRGIIYWLLVGAQHAVPLIGVWLWKLILDELTVIYQTKTASYSVWLLLIVYLLLQVCSSVLVQVNSVIYQIIKRKASYEMDMAIMQKMAQIDTAFFDDPSNSDALNAAQTSENYITGNMPWAVDTIIKVITFISGLAMFLSYDWLVGIIFMATYIPGAIVSYKHKRKVDEWSISNIPETRKKDYYKSLLTRSYAAKDLRLYNLADHFKKKYNELWSKIRNERSKLFVRGSVASFMASLLTYSGIVVIIVLSVRSLLLGGMAIGTFALYIGLAQTSGESFSSIIDALACQIEIDVPHVIQYINFLNYENTIKDEGTNPVPQYPEIEFRNIYFKYPGNDEYTLNNLSFKIESGKKIALIGVNGAGKTTVIKLLLRFYEPESGEILLDKKTFVVIHLVEFISCLACVFKTSIAIR